METVKEHQVAIFQLKSVHPVVDRVVLSLLRLVIPVAKLQLVVPFLFRLDHQHMNKVVLVVMFPLYLVPL